MSFIERIKNKFDDYILQDIIENYVDLVDEQSRSDKFEDLLERMHGEIQSLKKHSALVEAKLGIQTKEPPVKLSSNPREKSQSMSNQISNQSEEEFNRGKFSEHTQKSVKFPPGIHQEESSLPESEIKSEDNKFHANSRSKYETLRKDLKKRISVSSPISTSSASSKQLN